MMQSALDFACVIDRAGLDALIAALHRAGYDVLGPQVEDGAIGYAPLVDGSALPVGLRDETAPGAYRLSQTDSPALFDYTVGPQGAKRELFPPRHVLWHGLRDGADFSIEPEPVDVRPTALFGVRACELAAIAIQDRVFMGGDFIDSAYAARRSALFVVAINCGRASGTCFCVSMHTGPRATSGYDLALTEICEPGRHEFVLETGSERGAALVAHVPHRVATDADLAAAGAAVARAAAMQVRAMPPDAESVLKANLEHPRWAETAKRCLSCTNCTLVCPTCFCSTVEDVAELGGARIERERRWDSCFTLDFSYIHGGSVRRDPAARYRQWLTHKLAHWHDQFGSSGCTGCGRCIAWCPAGIDIVEEVAAIRESSAIVEGPAGGS
jgi:ferredoxin